MVDFNLKTDENKESRKGKFSTDSKNKVVNLALYNNLIYLTKCFKRQLVISDIKPCVLQQNWSCSSKRKFIMQNIKYLDTRMK